MSNILYISDSLKSLPIAIHLAEEGHRVDVINKYSIFKEANIRGITSIKDAQGTYDLTIYDEVEKAKDIQSPSIGSVGNFSKMLSSDFVYKNKVASVCKLKQLSYIETNTIEQLLLRLSNTSSPVVMHSSNDITIVSDNTIMPISVVAKFGSVMQPCFIQDKIEGTEIVTTGWFNGEKFIKPFSHSFKKRRMNEYDKGPCMPCSGILTFLVDQEDEIIIRSLLSLEELLKKVSYIGPISVTNIMKQSDFTFISYKAGFDYPILFSTAELLKMPLYNFLLKVATKQKDLEKRIEYIDEISIGVTLSTLHHTYDDIQMLSIEEGARKHVYLSDVCVKANKEVIAGIDNILCYITARGMNIKECQRRIYRTTKNIIINKDIIYRRDIGDDMYDMLNEYKRWYAHAYDQTLSDGS